MVQVPYGMLPNKGFRDGEVDRFNRDVPVGTRVRYFPVLPERGTGCEPVVTTTRSEAWRLGHGDGVVAITGKAGGVAISHIEVIGP